MAKEKFYLKPEEIDLIKEELERQKLNQRTLGDKLNLSASHVSRILKGTQPIPSLEILSEIYILLNMPSNLQFCFNYLDADFTPRTVHSLIRDAWDGKTGMCTGHYNALSLLYQRLPLPEKTALWQDIDKTLESYLKKLS